MQAQSSRPVNTFTIGFDEKRFDEAAHARSVAKHLGTAHTELRILPADALALVPELPRWFDEPFSSRSQIPTMLVSALARRQVTVALSGDGGDELFGGYMKDYAVAAVARAIRHVPGPLRHLAADAVDGVLAGIAALHGVLPVASRPRLSLNKVARLAAVVRVTDNLNALYRGRNATFAPSAVLVGTSERRCDGRQPGMPGRRERHGALRLFRVPHHAGRQHSHQGGSGEHGAQPRSAGAAPGPSRCRIRLATAADAQVRPPEREQAPAAPSSLSLRTARTRRPPEEGIQQPDRPLVVRPTQGLGGRVA